MLSWAELVSVVDSIPPKPKPKKGYGMSITLCIRFGLIFAEESKVLFHKTCRFVESICSPNYRCLVNCKLKIESEILAESSDRQTIPSLFLLNNVSYFTKPKGHIKLLNEPCEGSAVH